MVLESLFSARKIESKPVDMLLLSAIISFASVALAYIVFPEYAGVVFPLLITVGMAPVFYRILADEEVLEEEEAEGKISENFFQRYGEIVWLFSLFFIGVFAVVFFVSLFLPENFAQILFKPQLDSIFSSKSVTGNALSQGALGTIFSNNMKIIIFSFALSLFLSTGALWILGWNASVLGVYLAGFLNRGMFAEFASTSIGMFPHAPLEFAGYFLAGIAGGILSAGLIRRRYNFKGKEFRLVLRDSLLLLALAAIAIAAGAAVESYA
ncbi:MAG: stage II sporulation protein M [Candidatus Aenigmatarchaeota archaeon]